MSNKLYSEPLPAGFMRNGFFAWPKTRRMCLQCRSEFESIGNAQRCSACAKQHKRDWFRTRRKR